MAVSKQLGASPEQVFFQVNDVRNWENWSPWYAIDPDMEITYGEKVVGEGASYVWKGSKKSVGNGAMIISDSEPYEMVETTLKFEGYDESKATLSIDPADGGGSVVTWDFESAYNAPWPWQRYNMAIGRYMLKKAYEKGLKNIDDHVSENPEVHLIQTDEDEAIDLAISVVETEPFQAVAVERRGTIQDMEENGEQIFGEALGEVMNLVESEGHSISGQPFSLGHEWNEEEGTFHIEIGIPVERGGKLYGGGKAVKADYYGPYDGVGTAYEQIDAYMAENELTPPRRTVGDLRHRSGRGTRHRQMADRGLFPRPVRFPDISTNKKGPRYRGPFVKTT